MSKKKMILQAATRLFSEKGYKETSMAELAKMTGVAQGTIFYHYNNKERLFLSILKEFRQDIIAEFERHISPRDCSTGLEMMEEVISFYLYLAGAMEDRFLLLHRHDAYELAKGNPVCREYLEDIYNCLVDIFERTILVGQQDGSIRNLPEKNTALIIFTLVDGLVRFNTYRLYDAGAIYQDLIHTCRTILKNETSSK